MVSLYFQHWRYGQLEGLYLINSRADMEEVRAALAKKLGPGSYANSVSYPTRFGYALGQDIDMGSTAFKAMGGAKDTAFRAVFDGFGRILQNLNATADSLCGLFAYTRYATIRNLELANVSSTGGKYVAGLIGISDSGTVVSNVHVASGTIQGTSYVGGLIGMSNITTVSNGSNAASIKAKETYAGGIIGWLSPSTAILQNLYNAGSITATGNYAGGIIGFSCSPLTNATNVGTVTNTGAYTGGIIGYIPSSTALTKVRNLAWISHAIRTKQG